MDVGNFSDFLDTLTPEVIVSVCNDAKQKAVEMANLGSGDQILGMSWTISLEMLGLYHKWLEGQA